MSDSYFDLHGKDTIHCMFNHFLYGTVKNHYKKRTGVLGIELECVSYNLYCKGKF